MKGRADAAPRDGVIETLRSLPRVSRTLTALTVVLTVTAAVLSIAGSIASGALVGSIPAAVGRGFSSSTGENVLMALTAFAVVHLLSLAVSTLRAPIAEALGLRFEASIHERVTRAVQRPAGIAHIEDPNFLDRVGVALGVGAGLTPAGLVSQLVAGLSLALTTALAAVVVASAVWWLPLILLAASATGYRRMVRSFTREVTAAADEVAGFRTGAYLRDLALKPAAAKELRIFGLQRWVLDQFVAVWRDSLETVWAERRREKQSNLWIAVLVSAMVIGGDTVLGLAAARGDISIGVLTTSILAAHQLVGFGGAAMTTYSITVGGKMVSALLGFEETDPSSPALLRGQRRDADTLPSRTITFERVGFTYPGRQDSVFESLNLEIRAGESLAIVGSNGAGKTTLIKLLCRLYDPTHGRITADGIDLRELQPSAWQQRVAAVFQDFLRYELTVRDNLSLGENREEPLLETAARDAGILDVIHALPEGWETVLSRQYEGGAELSGGEWQRIALARALLAARSGNAGVLVLDEPTASLDVRAEANFYDKFLDLTHGITTIVVSHRFSTVRRVDRIVVLEHGQVVEDGSHEELLQLGGRYARMFKLQASRFVDDSAGA